MRGLGGAPFRAAGGASPGCSTEVGDRRPGMRTLYRYLLRAFITQEVEDGEGRSRIGMPRVVPSSKRRCAPDGH